jgi:hypothetical protein
MIVHFESSLNVYGKVTTQYPDYVDVVRNAIEHLRFCNALMRSTQSMVVVVKTTRAVVGTVNLPHELSKIPYKDAVRRRLFFC